MSIRVYKLIVLSLLILLVTGCDSAMLTSDSSSVLSERATKYDGRFSAGEGYDIRSIPSFDLQLSVTGMLQPEQPVQLRAQIVSKRDVQDVEVKILLPELEAVRASMREPDRRQKLEWPIGQAVSPAVEKRHSMRSGQSLTERVKVQFPEPGYYRVVAMVSDQSGKVTENGQWIDPADGEEIWLWIDEDGGQVTERFDESLFPDSLRMQPGPFVVKYAASRWVPVRNGKAVSGPPSKSGSATLVVTYFDPVDGVNKPLKDARVDIDIYDGYEDKVVGGGTLQTDQNGEVLVECEQEDPVYEVQISVLAENGDVVVYDQADSKQVSYLEDPACGATVVTDAYSSTSHVFSRMDVTIERSRNFFQRSRSKIPVKLSYSEGSLYWPDGWFINGHLYGGDYIVINEGDSRFSNSSGNRIIAHEYGHALHEKGLGGNATPPGGGCPDEHYLRGAHNLTCAFSEGFAQYHAGTTIDSENSFITALEDNEYYPALSSISTSGPLEDGSIIEGAVAAFLYDLTDPANESHDGANYPGMYVAEIIETCKVYEAAGWRRADGVDHLIACFQQSLPDYSTYFPNRGTPPFNFQENASEPGGWQAGDITLLWETNLFDAYTAPLSVTASGSSSLDSGEQGSWTASASGGNGSYSYQWFDKYEQDSGFQSISGATTSSYSASYYGNVTLKVEVTSGGSTDSDTHEVSVDCSTGPCVESLDEAQVVNR